MSGDLDDPVTIVSQETYDALVASLDAPEPPAPALEGAFERLRAIRLP